MESEKNKITYLIGAGASSNALPMIRPTDSNPGYTDSLRLMAEKLKDQKMIFLSECDEFVRDLNWLAEKSDEYGSPDAYVKFCTVKNDNFAVAKIKRVLSLYFTIEQFIEKKRDNRYLKFITKVIENNTLFPDNIKILNWNYDFQFQIAAETFKEEHFSINKNSITKHAPPLISYYPSLGHDFYTNLDSEKKDLSLVHLNGIAGFYFYTQNNNVLSYFMNNKLTKLDDVFENSRAEGHLKATLLTFAFDNQSQMTNAIRNRFSYASNIIQNTDYLVIIGYSFPVDNVQFDEQLFSVLKSNSLKEIFYQDPFNNGGFLRDLFDIDERVKITHIQDVKEFFIPRQFRSKRKSRSSS